MNNLSISGASAELATLLSDILEENGTNIDDFELEKEEIEDNGTLKYGSRTNEEQFALKQIPRTDLIQILEMLTTRIFKKFGP